MKHMHCGRLIVAVVHGMAIRSLFPIGCLLVVLGNLTPSFAQSGFQDVIYLKNGEVRRGMIIEEVPNVQLKIQTANGNVFVYTIDEIERKTKEPSIERKTKEPSKVLLYENQGRQTQRKISKEFGLYAGRYNYDWGLVGRHFLGVTRGRYSYQPIGNLNLVTGVNVTPTIYHTKSDPFGFSAGVPLNFRIGIEDAEGVVGFNVDVGISNGFASYKTYYSDRKLVISEQILAGPIISLRSDDLKIELGYMSFGRFLFLTDFDGQTYWPWSENMAGGDDYQISLKLLVAQ